MTVLSTKTASLKLTGKFVPLLLPLFVLAFFTGCEKAAEEEPRVVSKRMKIELPKDMVEASPETVAKKAEAKPRAEKPKVSWIKPSDKKTATKSRTTTARKKTVVKKPATPPTTVAAKTAAVPTAPNGRKETEKPYVVNLSSVTNKAAAEIFMRKLQDSGYTAYLTEATIKGTLWYRVRVGFFDTEAEAKAVQAELAKKYHRPDAWLTRPLWAEIDANRK